MTTQDIIFEDFSIKVNPEFEIARLSEMVNFLSESISMDIEYNERFGINEGVGDFFKGVLEKIKEALKAIKEFFKNIANKIKEKYNKAKKEANIKAVEKALKNINSKEYMKYRDKFSAEAREEYKKIFSNTDTMEDLKDPQIRVVNISKLVENIKNTYKIASDLIENVHKKEPVDSNIIDISPNDMDIDGIENSRIMVEDKHDLVLLFDRCDTTLFDIILIKLYDSNMELEKIIPDIDKSIKMTEDAIKAIESSNDISKNLIKEYTKRLNLIIRKLNSDKHAINVIINFQDKQIKYINKLVSIYVRVYTEALKSAEE